MKAVSIFLMAIALTAAPAIAQNCGNWKAPTTYAGKFRDGYHNTLVIQKVTQKSNACFVDLLYIIAPRGSFPGRTDIITETPLTTKGQIRFKTLGIDGGVMTYTKISTQKIKGIYRSGSKTVSGIFRLTR